MSQSGPLSRLTGSCSNRIVRTTLVLPLSICSHHATCSDRHFVLPVRCCQCVGGGNQVDITSGSRPRHRFVRRSLEVRACSRNKSPTGASKAVRRGLQCPGSGGPPL